MSLSQRKDMLVLAHIPDQFEQSLGSYGRPRMTEELKSSALTSVTAASLLNSAPPDAGKRHRCETEQEVQGEEGSGFDPVDQIPRRKTDNNYSFNVAPNLLNRDFAAERPNQKWAGDNSYVWTGEEWLYFAVMQDLHSRSVVGWAVSSRLKRDLAIRELKMAIALRRPPKDCVHHSDRGSQYCSHDYQKLMRQQGSEVSMSGTGNCYDNAAVETFFKTTIKVDLLWQKPWPTRRSAEGAIFGYINGLYNPRRGYSALAWKSPMAFNAQAA